MVQVFDVLLNGEVVIPELDIFKEAGGIGVAYDRLITFYVKKGILIVGNRRDTSSHLRITFAKGALDNPKINAFYVYRGPKTVRVSMEGETDDEIEDEELDLDSRVNMHRFEDEPLVADPYTEQDTNHMFIPFLVAFACKKDSGCSALLDFIVLVKEANISALNRTEVCRNATSLIE
ncbi:unnamed protein product [Gongylonema pulchrum]|uniref:Malectin domain-containing protein n=1 Tax=Gongylonema pulchrum TaxID=637853 RepID=A0A183E9I4_9BILA|nr:unnamed protein product [Gongylonema pulchrum]